MRALPRARALDRGKYPQLTAHLAQRRDIPTPRRAVKVDRQQPAHVVRQKGIDAHHLPTLQMREQLPVHRREERLA
jgi:hypothetical protein